MQDLTQAYSHIITAKEKLAANKMDAFYARLDDDGVKPLKSVF